MRIAFLPSFTETRSMSERRDEARPVLLGELVPELLEAGERRRRPLGLGADLVELVEPSLHVVQASLRLHHRLRRLIEPARERHATGLAHRSHGGRQRLRLGRQLPDVTRQLAMLGFELLLRARHARLHADRHAVGEPRVARHVAEALEHERLDALRWQRPRPTGTAPFAIALRAAVVPVLALAL